MGPSILQPSARGAWSLARGQHDVVARWQLLALGYSPDAIGHRLRSGRLHPTPWRGVYAVGRPGVGRLGRWSAALLACGPRAALSHTSATALYEIANEGRWIEVSVPLDVVRRRPGILVHRRSELESRLVTRHEVLRVTTPLCTVVDMAARLPAARIERMIDEADKRDLIDPETLAAGLDALAGYPGAAALRRVLARGAFILTQSELERLFLPSARRAGLPAPLTQQEVNGFDVDFYWPALGLVVETDGLRYHRTAAAQARDLRRDQIHTAAGLVPLRFSHAQIKFEPAFVEQTLAHVHRRLKDPGA